MSNTLRIKRRASGNPGAPAELENAELAFNEVDDTLYYGKGTGGANGTATAVMAIAGAIKANVNSPAFTGTPTAPTASPGTNNTQIATTAFVSAAVTAGSLPDGDKGDITVSNGGSAWSIDSGVVTNAKLATVPTATLKGRSSAGTGAPSDLSVSTVRTMLSINNVDNTSDANKPISTATQTALNAKLNSSAVGAANGVAPLGADSKVPSAFLPSYVDDVLEFANYAALPASGEVGVIYVTLDTGFIYRWGGTAYVQIAASPGSTDDVPEGSANLYFTEARARAAVISQSITNGDTTHAPSGDAVFDALALKANTSSLGTMAAQNANAVNITGGTIDGVEIDGGTF